jgi:hypothetical protein
VLLQQLTPVPITHFSRPFCGGDNVGEKDRRQNSIGRRTMPDSREKFLDLLEKRVRISDVGGVIRSNQLN